MIVGPDPQFARVCSGFIDYLNSRPRILSLSLAEGGLVRFFSGNPDSASSSYPCNPYEQCPRILLTGNQTNFDPRSGSNGDVHDFTCTLSLFYYRSQTPGQNNQLIQLTHVDQIGSAITRDKLRPAPLHSGAIPGFRLSECLPGVVTHHPDLWHRFSLDPNLVVSCSELNFTIKGTIVKYDDGT